MTEYKYFMIPSSAVPPNPSYTVWYATWTSTSPTDVGSGPTGPMVIGGTREVLPEGATLIATTSKDPPPPPLAPPPLSGAALESYQRDFASWLSTSRGFEL